MSTFLNWEECGDNLRYDGCWLRYKHNLRLYVRRRDGSVCFWCGAQLSHKKATLDHIVPKSKGGPLHAENVVYSCKSCNEDRADMDAEEYASKKWKP